MALFGYSATVIPGEEAAWSGSPPLRNGIGIAVASEVGTLGAAVKVRGQTYFTCARHVLRSTQDQDGDPTAVWRGLGAAGLPWQDCDDLRRVMDKFQPGKELYDPLDIAFLRTTAPAANVIGGGSPRPDAEVPAAGTALRYWGCRRGLVSATFDGTWTESSHASLFDPNDLNGLDTSACGVVRFTQPGYDYNAYTGDSGSSFWDGPACVGQLVGVSPSSSSPFGLIVLYKMAFSELGLPGYQLL
jgi:hypothetical protein